MSQQEGVYITSKMISMLVGVITILSAFWFSASHIGALGTEIDVLKSQDLRNQTSLDNLSIEIKELTSQIQELTITIREVQIIQNIEAQ